MVEKTTQLVDIDGEVENRIIFLTDGVDREYVVGMVQAEDALKQGIKVLLTGQGVEIRPNMALGGEVTPEGLRKDGYDAVLMAAGAGATKPLDIEVAELRASFIRYMPLGILIGVLMIVELLMVVGPQHFGLDKYAAPAKHAADYSNTKELGEMLYTNYLYPFEIAAVILLVAIVAAISLTLRRRPETRYLDPATQVLVKKKDRLRIIKMEAEE